MGSTMFEGGSITKCFQINQVKLPKPRIKITYKELKSVYNVYNIYTIYKDIQFKYKNVSETNKSQACP